MTSGFRAIFLQTRAQLRNRPVRPDAQTVKPRASSSAQVSLSMDSHVTAISSKFFTVRAVTEPGGGPYQCSAKGVS